MSKKSASSIVAKIANKKGEPREATITRIVNRAVSIHQKKESTVSASPSMSESALVGVHTPAIIAVKFRREEIEAIDAECQRNGRMSRAAWIRAAAHKALQIA